MYSSPAGFVLTSAGSLRSQGSARFVSIVETGATIDSAFLNEGLRLAAFRASPPGPDFDFESAGKPAPDQIDDPTLAAQNFRLARHFRFEQQRRVVDLRGHQ